MSSSALDLLCELMDDEDVHQEETPELAGGATGEVNDNGDDSVVEGLNQSAGDRESGHDGAADPVGDPEDDEEIADQLAAMQKQMKQLQDKLDRKKKLKDVDVFSGSSAETAASPEKTHHPFAENTGKFTAKTHLRTPKFGPSLPERHSRSLDKDEETKLLLEIKQREEKRKEKEAFTDMVRRDLADSSDEEEEKNPLEMKYNSFGKDVKRIARISSEQSRSMKSGFNDIEGNTINLSNEASNKKLCKDQLLIDSKFSRLRIARPLVDSAALGAHMLGKTFVPLHSVKQKMQNQGDWTTIGVIFHKAIQTSKNGNSYTLLRMTDLTSTGGLGALSNVAVFLFGRCHNVHYKLPLNRVVGLLNAKVMEDRAGFSADISLSVDHPDKVLELGDSPDIGKCKAKRKDGSGCTNLVNRGNCDFCAYHVKRAYKAVSSKRSDLQSSFTGGNPGGRGGADAGCFTSSTSRIMNKIDPKGSYFAAGQVVNNVAKMGARHRAKDNQALAALGVSKVDLALKAEEKRQKDALAAFKASGKALSSSSHLTSAEKNAVKSVAHGVSPELGLRLLSSTPGAKGLLKTLTKDSEKSSVEEASQKAKVNPEDPQHLTPKQMLFQHRQKLAMERVKQTQLQKTPHLGRGFGSGDFIDLSPSGSSPKTDGKKAKAVAALAGKSIPSQDPNYVPMRKRKAKEVEKSKSKVARVLASTDPSDEGKSKENAKKKAVDLSPKTSSSGEVVTKERLESILKAKSQNEHLVDDFERTEEEKEMDRLEKREAMEESMLSTKTVKTRAVSCSACGYTGFSQSDLCKKAGHIVTVLKSAVKSFFECCDCNRRTVSLDRYPKSACTKCGGSRWRRCGMAKAKKGPLLDSEKLLVRGVEQKFIGQTVASMELL